MNQQSFIEFLENLIEDEDRKIFLIIDNLKVHKSKLVSQWADEHKDRIELFEKSRKSDWLFAETRTASFEVPWRPFFRLPFGLEGSWPTEMGRMGMP